MGSRSLDAGKKKRRDMRDLIWLRSRSSRVSMGFLVAVVLCCVALTAGRGTIVNAGGAAEGGDTYRVLAPIQSGNLLLFPVVRGNGKAGPGTPFLTLDEGLKNGSVEVTEAGKVRGSGTAPRQRTCDLERSRLRGPGEYAGPRQQLQPAASAARRRNRHRGQAGPCDREGSHRSARRRPDGSFRVLHRARPVGGEFGRVRSLGQRGDEQHHGAAHGARTGHGGQRPAAGVEFGAWIDRGGDGGTSSGFRRSHAGRASAVQHELRQGHAKPGIRGQGG